MTETVIQAVRRKQGENRYWRLQQYLAELVPLPDFVFLSHHFPNSIRELYTDL